MSHPYAHYWNRGVANVPDVTGARAVLDGADFAEICGRLGIELPLSNALDVGCGTGRLARHCHGYFGVDIAESAIAYCRHQGLLCAEIDGVETLPDGPFDHVLCISVFTHVGREERVAYLARFVQIAPKLIVDIIPGDGTGAVEYWTAQADVFEDDLRAAGYRIVSVTDQPWDDTSAQHLHRHYYAERVV